MAFLHSPFIVNGGYSDWKPYDKCSKTCGGGVKTRERTCTNPPPSNGGQDCSGLGPNSTTSECNNQECPGKEMNITKCFLLRLDHLISDSPKATRLEHAKKSLSQSGRENIVKSYAQRYTITVPLLSVSGQKVVKH